MYSLIDLYCRVMIMLQNKVLYNTNPLNNDIKYFTMSSYKHLVNYLYNGFIYCIYSIIHNLWLIIEYCMIYIEFLTTFFN